MIYVTGDCHADFRKFSADNFPEQKEMSREDFVMVMGDFGIWHDTPEERYWLKWLSEKPFTTVFVGGNHENYDRLYSDEFEVVDFHGGKAQKIRDNVYHLMRGHIFDFDGKKFFAFGGARSHDIQDGILRREDYESDKALIDDYRKRYNRGELIRIEHISWWEQELPTDEEIEFGRKNLEAHGNKVDYIISHCAPQSVAAIMGFFESDKLTKFFEELKDNVKFGRWICGHYHDNRNVLRNYTVLYEQIVRLT